MPEHSPCYHSRELLVAIDIIDIFIWVTTQQNTSSATFVVGFGIKSRHAPLTVMLNILCAVIYLIIYYNPY